MYPQTRSTPRSRKHNSARKRRISAAPDRPSKAPKCQNLTKFDKIRILDILHERPAGVKLYEMIPVFREMGYATIVASTLSRLLREENAIRAYVVQNPQRLYEKRPPNLLLPEVDAAVSQWVVQTLSSPGAQLNGDMIREKAREFTHLLGYPNNILVFSNGWLERLKVRLGLSWHTFHGEASSAPVERLEDERFRLLAIIINYAPWDVYNVDEAALLFCFVPTSGLAFQKMPGVKLDKKFLTYVLCANMDGSDKRPPLIIGQAKQPRCFDKCSACEVDFYYFWNTKAWMVYSIWQHFLFDLNEDMRRQGRHILLLCDNAPSHKHNPANYSNIRIEFLAPNLTSWVQPMNGGIIASFEAQYKRRFARLALDRNNLGIANMYKIDQLQAMHMAADAWRAVVPQTIANCWRHVGLVPNHYALDNPLLPPPQPPTFAPTYPPHAMYPPYQAHVPPQLHPSQYEYELGLENIHPEVQKALDQLDVDLITENWWTDGEIVNQIIAERQEGFIGEDEEYYDL